jgi:hypothetical protein
MSRAMHRRQFKSSDRRWNASFLAAASNAAKPKYLMMLRFDHRRSYRALIGFLVLGLDFFQSVGTRVNDAVGDCVIALLFVVLSRSHRCTFWRRS